MKPLWSAAALGVAALTAHANARAAPVWIGDMETGDVSQWEGALNGEHISVVTSPTVQGSYAARIQLTNDAVWSNGLKRVELHHSPDAARTAEGAETWFAWSLFLPRVLPTDPVQVIGYWESDNSYQGTMYFEVQGEHILFTTRKPRYAVQWEADAAMTAGVWHRIALHIRWSKDPSQGFVDAWFDGEEVVHHADAQTLVDDNTHFTQVGLLRDAIRFQDSPIILIDDAVEGDSEADVHPSLGGPSGSGGAGGSNAATGGGGASAGPSASGNGAGASGSETSTVVGAGGSAATPGGDDDGGCGCRVAPLDSSRVAGVIALVAPIAFAARRRPRRASART